MAARAASTSAAVHWNIDAPAPTVSWFERIAFSLWKRGSRFWSLMLPIQSQQPEFGSGTLLASILAFRCSDIGASPIRSFDDCFYQTGNEMSSTILPKR